jgi:tetratricopeptide (TPR) repeat protein
MSLFDNLFGRKKPKSAPVPPKPSIPAVLPPKKNQPNDPSKDPNMIKVFDAYGREMFITKEAWRTQVLPGTLKSNWNNAEQLAGVVIGSMNDGFFADVLAAAEQLCRIDPIPARGACAYGIVLMKINRLDEAEKVFQSYIQKHGEDGSILTNLAKVYSARNDHQKAEQILWHGLEVDPNQDNGFGWYAAIHRERGGEAAALDAMRRVAALPGSWRAQLWLARQALQARKLEEALQMYQECLARAAKPVPADLLMQMSGDLGNSGHLPQILQLVEPHFDAKTHGLLVGNNLIKAHLDLGQIDAARRILDQLYALNRMDWKQNLSYWDTELAKARVASAPVDQKTPMQMAMLTIEGPVWLKPTSPAAELFPARTADALAVAFLGCSTEVATNSKRIERQMADASGRMSRALPLFLAEQVEFGSQTRVQTLVPWIANAGGGFVLSGAPWKDEDAANYARQGEIKNDYAVTIHLKPNAEPWTAELRLIRTIDAKCLGTLSGTFPSAKPEDGIPVLAQQLLTLLREQAEVEPVSNPPLYQVPVAPHFAYYLLRLEQLLAVRCGGMDGARVDFLSGEREIIDGNIQQCLNLPQNVPARLLLAQTMMAMKRARPDILPEFKDKLALLQKEKPLPEPAQGVVQRMFTEVLAA